MILIILYYLHKFQYANIYFDIRRLLSFVIVLIHSRIYLDCILGVKIRLFCIFFYINW